MARCPSEGAKLKVVMTPAATQFYAADVRYNRQVGVVVTVPVPGGRKTCMPGPRGGLIYLRFSDGHVTGIFRADLQKLDGSALGGLGETEKPTRGTPEAALAAYKETAAEEVDNMRAALADGDCERALGALMQVRVALARTRITIEDVLKQRPGSSHPLAMRKEDFDTARTEFKARCKVVARDIGPVRQEPAATPGWGARIRRVFGFGGLAAARGLSGLASADGDFLPVMLTPEQLEEIKREMTHWRPEDRLPGAAPPVPVRFLYQGRAVMLESGRLQQKGINVMHQQVYWNFPKATSRKIAKWLGVTPVFDTDDGQVDGLASAGMWPPDASDLRAEAAQVLGWPARDAQTMSLRSLRELVRGVDAGLAAKFDDAIRQMELDMHGGRSTKRGKRR